MPPRRAPRNGQMRHAQAKSGERKARGAEGRPIEPDNGHRWVKLTSSAPGDKLALRVEGHPSP